MKTIKIDGTAALKRRIEDLINDLKHIPIAEHAVRELRILNSRLTITDTTESPKL